MTMTPVRLLRLLILALTVTCAACALQGTTPVKPAPGGGHPGALRVQPKGPAYAAPQLAIGERGMLYLLWLGLERGKSWDVLFARSNDLGATWSRPPFSLKPNKTTVGGGIQVSAGSGETVYVVWREWDRDTKQRNLRLIRSADGGRQWDDLTLPPAISADMGIPRLLANRNGDIAVAWLAGPRDRRGLAVVSSRNAGANISSEPIRLTAAFPTSEYGIMNHQVTSDAEGRLYVAWEEMKTPSDRRIYLNRSLDQGKTWEAQPILVSTPNEAERHAYMPQILGLSDGQVYVAWTQDEFRANQEVKPGEIIRPDRFIYVNRSLDYGRTWLARPIRVNEAGQGPPIGSGYPWLGADRHGNVYVTWIEEEAPRPGRILFTHSPDAGLTWSAPIRLDLTSPFKGRPAQPQLHSDEVGHIWVIWQELASGSAGWQLLMNRSEDHGGTWREQAVALTGPAQRGGSFRGVSFRNDIDGRLFVAWDGGPENSQEIYFNRSTDFGATWLSREVQVGR